jgi:chromosomal replication initiator protein
MTMQNLWHACLRRLEQELPAQQFNTWIRPLAPDVAAEGPTTLVLAAPNRFILEHVRDTFVGRIRSLVTEAGSREIEVKLVLARAATADASARAPAPVAGPGGAVDTPERARLNRTFTFDTVVTGKANQLARAAAMQVGENPGISYNPLFIYGGVGLGKTHLLQAIGNRLAAERPQARIRYIHAEQYVTDVVRAYQQKSFEEFKRYYHSLDLLLIDDIQFFSNKDRTQEEFFYAFNALVEAHKQIVITCDTYPKEIAGMQERLISRFGWGLTVAIEPPELEMRGRHRAQEGGSRRRSRWPKTLPSSSPSTSGPTCANWKARLRKVLAFARFTGRELSLELAREALRDILHVANRQINVEGIRKPSRSTSRSRFPTCTPSVVTAISRGRGRWRWPSPRI